MGAAAGEDGIVDQASMMIEVAVHGGVATVHVKVDDPAHPHVVSSAQTFHLRRENLDMWRFANVVRQAVGHAAIRVRETPPIHQQSALDLIARIANLIRGGENDALFPRDRPDAAASPAGGERPELVVDGRGVDRPPA